jgi:predicted TIM-barrel fold metal-dependent hydrolase
VTKPSQFDTINQYAAEINGKEGVISFGGIHPDIENYKKKLNIIKSLGLKGIKLHPDYQGTFVDDPRMVRIIQYAVELDLIVVLHAGLDIGLPNPIHCPPRRSVNMLSQLENKKAKIVLAHTGGYDQWDEVEEYLVGRNVWLDTSFSMNKLNSEQFTRIVHNHGADRLLFATDSPWGGQSETVDWIRGMELTEEELERIFWRNGAELLGYQIIPDKTCQKK